MVKRTKQVKRPSVKAAAAVPAGYQAQIVPILEGYFSLKEHGTDIRTEFIAGVTTFLTMVYIVFVNPQILGKAGMDPGRCSSPPASRPP
jgi:hypothetical protein